MRKNHKSLLSLIREHVNIYCSGLVLRKDLIELAKKNGNTEKYVDQIRRQLTKVGYLEDTKQLGVYRVITRIPLALTTDKLRIMYDKSFSDYDKKTRRKRFEEELIEIEIKTK